MTNLLLVLAVLVWPLGQLLQLSPFGQVIRLQTLDIFAGLLFLSLLFHRKKVIKDALFKPLALFIFAATISWILAFFRGSAGQASFLYLLRFIAYTSFYYAFRIEGIKKFTKYFLISGIVFLSLGFLQYIFIPDTRLLKYIVFDDHYYRLIGSFLDPNYTGLALAVFTLLFLNLQKIRRFFFIPLIALVLTFSRAAYLSLAAGIIYLVIARKQFKLLVSLILLGVILFLAPKPFGEGVNLLRTFSIESRLANQTYAVSLFTQNPIFGVGFNTLKNTATTLIPNLTSGVDNSFLFILATTGIIGFFFFLNILKVSWGRVKKPVIKACLIAIFTHSLFNNSLFYSWILALFFLLLSYRKPKAKTSP